MGIVKELIDRILDLRRLYRLWDYYSKLIEVDERGIGEMGVRIKSLSFNYFLRCLPYFMWINNYY